MDKVSGAGAKPAPQKGWGKARIGSKRSPLMRKGGKIHGPVPWDLSIDMPRKVRLLAIKTMLSVKLYEDKLIFMTSEKLPSHKTKLLAHCLQGFAHKWVLFVTPLNPDKNFTLAVNALENRWTISPQDLNVKDMLKADYVIITKDALVELE